VVFFINDVYINHGISKSTIILLFIYLDYFNFVLIDLCTWSTMIHSHHWLYHGTVAVLVSCWFSVLSCQTVKCPPERTAQWKAHGLLLFIRSLFPWSHFWFEWTLAHSLLCLHSSVCLYIISSRTASESLSYMRAWNRSGFLCVVTQRWQRDHACVWSALLAPVLLVLSSHSFYFLSVMFSLSHISVFFLPQFLDLASSMGHMMHTTLSYVFVRGVHVSFPFFF